jgi:hypothetical protein
MRYLILVIGLLLSLLMFHSCTPNRGCTETTADNYDLNAEEDDGTCIPARDKLIGSFRYTKTWTDVVGGGDFVDIGTFQATEANTGHNAFNFFFDGNLLLQGSITQNNVLLETHQVGLASSYSGNGIWLESDTVDMLLNVTFISEFLPVPQPYSYFCTKLPD